MCNVDREIQNILAIQSDMFRLAKRDYQLSPKRLAALSGIPEATVASWAHPQRPAAMPMHGFVRLLPHLPDDLSSLLTEPADKHIGTNAPSDNDIHDLIDTASELTNEGVRAMHPKSPGGVHIVPSERGKIRDISRRLAPRARKVAAS
jgi:hypothetical protein